MKHVMRAVCAFWLVLFISLRVCCSLECPQFKIITEYKHKYPATIIQSKLSDDGKQFYIITSDGGLYCYALNGVEQWHFKYPGASSPQWFVSDIAASPNGTNLAALAIRNSNSYVLSGSTGPLSRAQLDAKVIYFDSGRLKWELTLDAASKLHISPNGMVLVEPLRDEYARVHGKYRLIDSAGNTILSIPSAESENENANLTAGFSDTGDYLFIENRILRGTGSIIAEFGYRNYILAVLGKYAFVQSFSKADSVLKVYDMDTDKMLWRKTINQDMADDILTEVSFSGGIVLVKNAGAYELKDGESVKFGFDGIPEFLIPPGYFFVKGNASFLIYNKSGKCGNLRTAKDDICIANSGMLLCYTPTDLRIYGTSSLKLQ